MPYRRVRKLQRFITNSFQHQKHHKSTKRVETLPTSLNWMNLEQRKQLVLKKPQPLDKHWINHLINPSPRNQATYHRTITQPGPQGQAPPPPFTVYQDLLGELQNPQLQCSVPVVYQPFDHYTLERCLDECFYTACDLCDKGYCFRLYHILERLQRELTTIVERETQLDRPIHIISQPPLCKLVPPGSRHLSREELGSKIDQKEFRAQQQYCNRIKKNRVILSIKQLVHIIFYHHQVYFGHHLNWISHQQSGDRPIEAPGRYNYLPSPPFPDPNRLPWKKWSHLWVTCGYLHTTTVCTSTVEQVIGPVYEALNSNNILDFKHLPWVTDQHRTTTNTHEQTEPRVLQTSGEEPTERSYAKGARYRALSTQLRHQNELEARERTTTAFLTNLNPRLRDNILTRRWWTVPPEAGAHIIIDEALQ